LKRVLAESIYSRRILDRREWPFTLTRVKYSRGKCFSVFDNVIMFDILADRTNGRAYATVLCPSVMHVFTLLWLRLTEKLSEEANRNGI